MTERHEKESRRRARQGIQRRVPFPVYGLSTDQRMRRYADFFQIRYRGADSEVTELWLGHTPERTDPGARQYAVVASLGLAGFSPGPLPGGDATPSAAAHAAFTAAFRLANVTLPVATVPRPAGFLRRLVDLVGHQAHRCPEWTPTTWYLDGTPISARCWRFADGWAAFTETGTAVPVAATGEGLPVEGLRLTTVTDARPYGFSLENGIRPADLVTCPTGPAPTGFHADHEPLLGAAG